MSNHVLEVVVTILDLGVGHLENHIGHTGGAVLTGRRHSSRVRLCRGITSPLLGEKAAHVWLWLWLWPNGN